METTLFREFSFEAGRYLPGLPPDHPCSRMHGHTFLVRISVTGQIRRDTGWLMDFDVLDEHIERVKRKLDHRVLNEIAGLENPTTELLAVWIWDHLAGSLPDLSRVQVRENPYTGCVYTGN